ncbi:hypothetical protein C834K_0847 [Chlamydia poikilotherma]|uniref:Uncharacterized protein n=1 Tax=Chlamydia poikilotherma TaxID=1967783 RepID=A0A3B0PWP5_9CHLA|nr:hypothetical protein [Chlamydia poikilotherma]SYX09286.1 hypothetical protein C834K_0847 [Chlamydia poikilotherma]
MSRGILGGILIRKSSFMRILLALLSCLLIPCQLVQATEETSCPVTLESSTSHVFENYDEALTHAQKENIPLVIVLMSDTHKEVLDELITDGLDLSDFFGFSLEDMAAIVVLQPKDGDEKDSSAIDDFKNRFPGSEFPENSGLLMVTILVETDQETLLDITELNL